MTPGAGGSPGAGRPSGQNGVAGRVTGVNGQSLSVQNAGDNTTITVMTSGTTVFTKICFARAQ